MKKNSSKNFFMGVVGVGLVVIIALYMLVYQEYTTKTQTLKANNTSLRSEINQIEIHYNNRDVYRNDTEIIRTAMQDMVDDYPADAREEDVVMMAVDMQSVSTIKYDEINIDASEVLYTVPVEEVTKAGVESLVAAVEFVERKCTYTGELDYTSLKNCVQQIYSNPGRIGIHNVSIVKEETLEDGVVFTSLKGNIDVSFYSMTGTGKEYVPPKMADYEMGTDNPFRLYTESEAEF